MHTTGGWTSWTVASLISSNLFKKVLLFSLEILVSEKFEIDPSQKHLKELKRP